MKNDFPRCGELYWIELDPSLGTESKKRRPCVILSNNAYNKYSTRIIAAPVTSQVKKVYPSELIVNVLGKPGKVMLDQIRSFDKQRLRGKLSELNFSEMKEIGETFKNIFDFI